MGVSTMSPRVGFAMLWNVQSSSASRPVLTRGPRFMGSHPWTLLLAPVVNLTGVAGENLTVGSGFWLPAASVAPGR